MLYDAASAGKLAVIIVVVVPCRVVIDVCLYFYVRARVKVSVRYVYIN